MGNIHSSHPIKIQLQRHPHQRFGSALYSQDNMCVKFEQVGLQNYQDWRQIEFSLRPLSSRILEKTVCSEFIHVEVQYPAFPLCLTEEISRRALRDKEFTAGELLYFLYAVSEACLSYSKGEKAGHMTSSNILLSGEGHPVFITALSTPTWEHSPAQPNEFLAPGGCVPFALSYIKSDSYCIGMLLLSLLLLEPSCDTLFSRLMDEQFYDQFVDRGLRKAMEKNWLLHELLKGMLMRTVKDRLTYEDVIHKLAPYEKSIVSLQSFRVKEEAYGSFLSTKEHSGIKESMAVVLQACNYIGALEQTPIKQLQ